MTTQQMVSQIRWFIRRDLPEVMSIERESFDDPWTEAELLDAMRPTNTIGMVVEVDDRILGFMIYRLEAGYIELHNIAVAWNSRGEGIGRQMVDKLIFKLEQQRRKRLIVRTRESNLGAQLFFKRCGLKAIRTDRDYYANGEDAYLFTYELGECND